MFRLLWGALALALGNARACFFYALPTLALFAAAVRLLLDPAAPAWWSGLCVAALLPVKTLFVYAIAAEMLHPTRGRLNWRQWFGWRARHGDFFLFVGMGMLVMGVLAVYFVDAMNYLWARAEYYRLAFQAATEATGMTGEAAAMEVYSSRYGSYAALAAGSKALAVGVLVAALVMWSAWVRMGIRIPAHVEGYYLRREEAFGLTRHLGWAAMAVSLFVIAGVSAMGDVVAEELGGLSEVWRATVVWTGVYFVLVVVHVGLWVYIYFGVKKSGYYMSRLS